MANGSRVEFSVEAFGRFLDNTFGVGTLALERVGGGQSNPTFFVTHGSRRVVLRKKPAGDILSGARQRTGFSPTGPKAKTVSINSSMFA